MQHSAMEKLLAGVRYIMGRSRGRKRKPEKQQAVSPLQKETRWQLTKEIAKRPWARTVELTGLLASAIVFWDVYTHTSPEIRADDSDPSAPFSLPFSVKNDSYIFDLGDARWRCGFRWENEVGRIVDFGTDPSGGITRGTVTTIPPRGIKNYRCSIGMPAAGVKSLTASIHVTFTTFWVPRRYDTVFTWLTNTTKPQWRQGPIIE